MNILFISKVLSSRSIKCKVLQVSRINGIGYVKVKVNSIKDVKVIRDNILSILSVEELYLDIV